ncbi:hypothetical protein GCM10010266_59760 [Streptomyces griseomycini]|nr:hypothetical protein GCM10010266_59760 [Streptomyces griseomycini]
MVGRRRFDPRRAVRGAPARRFGGRTRAVPGERGDGRPARNAQKGRGFPRARAWSRIGRGRGEGRDGRWSATWRTPAPSISDSALTRVDGRHVEVVAWYGNEWGFSNRVIDTLELLAIR